MVLIICTINESNLTIGTEIWFRTDKKCGRTDGMDGRSQNYIPLTSSGDNKMLEVCTNSVLLPVYT